MLYLNIALVAIGFALGWSAACATSIFQEKKERNAAVDELTEAISHLKEKHPNG